MMKMWHFYYSEGQDKVISSFGSRGTNMVEIGGNRIPYTEIVTSESTEQKPAAGKWEDYEYLGCLAEDEAWGKIEVNK